ncbi:protein FAR1-RELATED SEQUENCE 9-like [Camellia sinensis]|uniref:protein FAR1-RELATED SEQUENCE 9-like n=1 Tax=Camellia sinensis TaxID=4442 RepID=UPI001036AA15|nr:protein FAR1-RELATED SEQUENCE 9-like [Camellia sinensis]
MTTTQCSESMNSVVKKYVNYKHDLFLFFQHFQRLINDCRYEELKADFRASQSTPSLTFLVEILKHAASMYSQEVFELFQAKLCKAYDCNMHLCGEDGTVTEYKIIPYHKRHDHTVTYDSSKGTVVCSCKKFEFMGILCSHALKVFSSKNVMKIPGQYILKRWTKDVKSGSIEVTSISYEDPMAVIGGQYKELCHLCTQLATRAAEMEKTYKIALDGLNKILEEVNASLRGVVIVKTCLGTSHANNNLFKLNKTICVDGIDVRVRGIKVKREN